MIPTLREAKRRGWTIHGAFSDAVVKIVMMNTGLFSSFVQYSGFWKGRQLLIPLADHILNTYHPDAVVIDISSTGSSGACWIEECYKRKITAIEFHSLNSHVWYYGKKSRKATAKYIAAVKDRGYAGISHHHMLGTPAMQFVGLMVGDQLLQDFQPGDTREALGLDRDQRFATLCGVWNKDFYGELCTKDLAEWSVLARRYDVRLAFSIHPNMRRSQGLPRVEFPPDVILTSNTPSVLWGRPVRVVPTVDLVRASEFLIFQFANVLRQLGMVARIPQWTRRQCGAQSGNPSRVVRETEEDEPRFPSIGGWKGPSVPVVDMGVDMMWWKEPCWRTQEHLNQLFAGTLGCKPSEEEAKAAREGWPAYIDGFAAARIVNLLEEKGLMKCPTRLDMINWSELHSYFS